MVYFVATLSALVTGGLLALGTRVITGIEHQGVLVAVGVFGGAVQWLVLLGWYLHHTRQVPPPVQRIEPEA